MDWFVFAFLSAVLLSFYQILRKKALKFETVMDYLALYSLLCFLMLLPFVSKVNFDLSLFAFVMIFLKSVVACLGFIFTTKAYKSFPVSTVAPLLLLTPLVFLGISSFYLKEPVKMIHLLGIFLLIFGTYILELDHTNSGKGFRNRAKHLLSPLQVFKKGYFHYIIFAVIFFSISITFDKVMLNPEIIGLNMAGLAPFTLMFFFRFFAVIIFVSVLFFIHGSISEMWQGFGKSYYWIIFAAIAFNLADLFYYNAMSIAFAALVIPVKRLSVLFTTLIGGELFHESNIIPKSMATAIMIGGVAIICL